jgi:hypothetical protein
VKNTEKKKEKKNVSKWNRFIGDDSVRNIDNSEEERTCKRTVGRLPSQKLTTDTSYRSPLYSAVNLLDSRCNSIY